MLNRTPVLAGLALVLALVAGAAWWQVRDMPQDVDADEVLPLPPIPPRIAQGAEYERCLSMLNTDPSGAQSFADAWFATGGGDGAAHCQGLAAIALGEPDVGAEQLDKLAARSNASPTARAAVYGQAGQAWLMAGTPDRALASSTLALAMTPDDPDLLIDRSVAEASMERYKDAVDDLSRALSADPRRADALVFRAAAYRHLNQLGPAQEDIDHAFVLDPENPDALLERGILRQRQGDRAGARKDWEQAMALAPDTATADLAQQNLALLDAGPERR